MGIEVDASFPGGNIVIEEIAGDSVRLHQDIRTTKQWWFYWAFRTRGAAGRTVRFCFTDGDAFTAQGPCFSPDGLDWQWLGRASVKDNAFDYRFPDDQDGAYFSFCIPYTEKHLASFLAAHRLPHAPKPAPRCSLTRLADSEKGRAIERLTLESQRGAYKVLLTARCHACETMGNYVLEGLVEAWLDDPFLREHVDFQIVPFVDKDGVEEGDQGKCRAPHDHWEDYTAQPLYAATRALIAQVGTWRGEFVLALDLHCPWIRGGRNEEIFIVEPPARWLPEVDRFARLLEDSITGELPFSRRNDIGYGVEWNVASPNLPSFVREHYPVRFAAALEIPYAVAGGKVVTAAAARAFGRDLGRAAARYIAGK